MFEIKIYGLTKKGREALQLELVDRQRMNWLQKKAFDKIFIVEVVLEPYCVTLRARDHMAGLVRTEAYQESISKAMESDGCKSSDYRLEIKEV